MATRKLRAWLSWLYLAVLFVLCLVLAALQYRWIGAVSSAERDRLHSSLQASLNRLSADFNSELAATCRSLLAWEPTDVSEPMERLVEYRWPQWKQTGRNNEVFRAIAVAEPRNNSLVLNALDFNSGVFQEVGWPGEWEVFRKDLESRMAPDAFPGRPRPPEERESLVLALPLRRLAGGGRGRPGRYMAFASPREGWVIVELRLAYLRDVLLAEVLQRHLGIRGNPEYYVEVLTRANPPSVIYQSSPDAATRIASQADASVGLFDLQAEQFLRRLGPPVMRERDGGRGEPIFGRGAVPGPGRGIGPGLARWELRVRNRAGSLEAVVSRTRRRNLGVTGGVLLLMLASFAALIQYTRRSQKLAEMQMNFVAGVSHELRTPLTVLQTAGYNLHGKLARDPGQVERYGALIQRESARLRDLVEQVLQFASGKAGAMLRDREPMPVERAIDEAIESAEVELGSERCQVEKKVESGLPLILGDPAMLKHAIQNLIGNAAKYGNGWIGVYASSQDSRKGPVVEIRVADRGPGIPKDEQRQIFDPFFRGRKALQDQIHGTGLGLSLAKGIVEAHGGVIQVHSEPGKGAEFLIRVPAAPKEYQDEFTNSVSRG